MRRLALPIVLLVVVVLSLAFVLPVFADKPLMFSVTWDDNYESVDICPFIVSVHDTATALLKYWFTEQGPPLKTIISFARSDVTYSNPATGRSVNVNAQGPITFTGEYELRDGILYQSITAVYKGTYSFATVPGAGVVSGSAGQTIWRVTQPCDPAAGGLWECPDASVVPLEAWTITHPAGVSGDNQDALCAYLAGQ